MLDSLTKQQKYILQRLNNQIAYLNRSYRQQGFNSSEIYQQICNKVFELETNDEWEDTYQRKISSNQSQQTKSNTSNKEKTDMEQQLQKAIQKKMNQNNKQHNVTISKVLLSFIHKSALLIDQFKQYINSQQVNTPNSKYQKSQMDILRIKNKYNDHLSKQPRQSRFNKNYHRDQDYTTFDKIAQSIARNGKGYEPLPTTLTRTSDRISSIVHEKSEFLSELNTQSKGRQLQSRLRNQRNTDFSEVNESLQAFEKNLNESIRKTRMLKLMLEKQLLLDLQQARDLQEQMQGDQDNLRQLEMF